MPPRVYLPRREWDQLGSRRRREVARCARRGREHPDPYVAAVARAVAAQVIRMAEEPDERPRWQRVGEWLLGAAVLTALAAVFGGAGAGGSIGDDARTVRLARRIHALP